MTKTLSIILAILVVILLGYIFFMPTGNPEHESQLESDNKKLKAEFSKLDEKYKLKEKHLTYLEGQLLESRATVKLSEQRLYKAEANEKVLLKQVKEQTRLMSDVEADSTIRYRFREDPDSIGQKILFQLASLDQCNSVRSSYDSTLQSYRKQTSLSYSVISSLSQMNDVSRQQISVLQESSANSDQIINNKDKEIKKLKRKNRVLKVIAPVAVVLTVILLL